MKFKSYPKYKPSGVEWLGDIPAHWDVKRLKLLCDVQTGDKDTVNAVDDGLYPFFVRSQTIERINSFTFNCEAILTAGDGAGVGKVFHHYNGLFDFHQRVYMLNNFRGMSGRLMFYFLKEHFHRVALEGGSKSTVDSLRMPLFLNFPVPVSSSVEDHAIAAFLDRETAKIDTLITKQENLIELLKEKRQAVISHAVTKGLDPTVSMKPSGVEWLGDVPQHWNICQIKRVLSSSDYGISESLEAEGKIPILRMGNIIDGQVSMNDLKFTNSLLDELVLMPTDILFNRTNSLALVGKVGMYKGSAYTQVGFASYLVRLRVNDRALPKYLTLLFNSDFVLQRARSDAIAAIGQANLNPTRYGTIRIPIPAPEEQETIIGHIESQTSKIDALIAKAQQAIILQKEHRTALISAAVTGKIDVREAASELREAA